MRAAWEGTGSGKKRKGGDGGEKKSLAAVLREGGDVFGWLGSFPGMIGATNKNHVAMDLPGLSRPSNLRPKIRFVDFLSAHSRPYLPC
jgi:hypothetical protein